MGCVGIFYNEEKMKSRDLAKEAFAWFSAKGKSVCYVTPASSAAELAALECAVSIGGDGSLIKLASILKQYDIPVMGVNAGSLGFLTYVRAEEMCEEFRYLLDGNYHVETRYMLEAYLERDPQTIFGILNDVVITREGLTRFLEVTVTVDESTLASFGGDGIIIATPTGSTAYSLSAGGPLIYPTLDAMAITPLCPHVLRKASYVLPRSSTVRIRINYKHADECACVIFDGHDKRTIDATDTVIVRGASHTFKLIKGLKHDYFSVVEEKL